MIHNDLHPKMVNTKLGKEVKMRELNKFSELTEHRGLSLCTWQFEAGGS